MEYTKAATILTLMLSNGIKPHDELKSVINGFTVFLMESDQNNPEYNRYLAHNWKLIREKIEAVVEFEEKRI